jgi:hypothetical protein
MHTDFPFISTLLNRYWLFVLLSILPNLLTAEITVSARFNPATVSKGEGTRYELVIEGSQGDIAGNLPNVDGIKLSNTPSVSNNWSIINGTHSQTKTYSFYVQTQQEGTYQMPSWEVHIDKNTYRIPPATLTVTKAEAFMENAWSLRTTVNEPEQTLMLGERRQLQVQLWVREDIGLLDCSHPSLVNDATHLQVEINTDQPDQQTRTQQGQRFTVITWPVNLTAIRAGTYSLEFQIQMIVQVPEKRQTRNRMRDPFMDSFFSDAFFNNVQRQQLTLKSEPSIQYEITELPKEGQPAGFSGAIGTLQPHFMISARETRTGEPLTATFTIEGTGNLAQIKSPEFKATSDWKLYPPKIETSDPIGGVGSRVFTYLLIPQTPGKKPLPELEFTWYDLESKTYKHWKSEPMEIVVSGEAIQKTQFNIASDGAPASTHNAAATPVDLLPLQISIDKTAHTLKPLYLRPEFALWQSLPASLLLGSVLVGVLRNRRERDPFWERNRHASRKLTQSLRMAEKAASSGDAAGFFTDATRCIQEAVIQYFPANRTANTLTAAEIEEQIGNRLDPQTLAQLNIIFRENEAHQFGAGSQNHKASSLGSTVRELKALLNTLLHL